MLKRAIYVLVAIEVRLETRDSSLAMRFSNSSGVATFVHPLWDNVVAVPGSRNAFRAAHDSLRIRVKHPSIPT
jgi:hypothetical protein